METIQPTYNISGSITIIPNDFIDRHMAGADGEYIKIYLLILRLTSQGIPVDTERIADTLELTRKDVLRALSYWKKEGLLVISESDQPIAADKAADASSDRTDLVVLQLQPSADGDAGPDRHNRPAGEDGAKLPEKPVHDASELNRRISGTELEQVIFMAETYIGHPLSLQELNSLCYISDELHFAPDLLEYLVEYCAERGKKQMRYMEKVAVNWYQQGIDTVRKAADQSALYTQNVFPVMKAFGISGRNPGQSEMNYISSWTSMGFGTDIIIEACNRTLLATHQASFPYANRILEGWKKAGIRSITDIRSLDQAHRARSKVPVRKTGPANSFHNFDQRTYDYDDLESRLSR